MKSLKLLARHALLFSLKLLLVAIPAVVASYFSYRAATRENLRQQQEFVETLSQVTIILDRQSVLFERHDRVIEQMKGQINVLRMLAAARTGAGVVPMPAEYEDERDGPRVSMKASKTPVRSLP